MSPLLPLGELAPDLFPAAGQAASVRIGHSDLRGLFTALLDTARADGGNTPGLPVDKPLVPADDLFAKLLAATTPELDAPPVAAQDSFEAIWNADADHYIAQAVAAASQAISKAHPVSPQSATADIEQQAANLLLDIAAGKTNTPSVRIAGTDAALWLLSDTIDSGAQPLLHEPFSPIANTAVRIAGSADLDEKPAILPSDQPLPGKTRNLTVRIDQDAWERLQRIHTPAKLEIPIELDIPERPVPVGHDVVRQLQALTEYSRSAPVTMITGLPSEPVNESQQPISDLFALPRAGRSAVTMHPLRLSASPVDPLHSESTTRFETNHRGPLPRLAEDHSAARLRPETHTRLFSDQFADSQRLADVQSSQAARSAFRAVTIPGAEAITSATETETLSQAPQVRFALDEWAPGRPANHLRITLDPADLGEVRVHLSARRQGVFARIVVDRPEAMKAVQANFDTLRATLAHRGVQFSGFSVSVANASSAVGLTPTGHSSGTAAGRKLNDRNGRAKAAGKNQHSEAIYS